MVAQLRIGGVGFGEGPHVFDVAGRKATHIRKLRFQINSQPVNDLCPPPLNPLLLQDSMANFPINGQQLRIDG